MADDFFGQYLVSKKVITWEQLQRAVMIQTQDRLLLGEIALKEGMLSAAQLREILQEQRMSGQKFGQIARAKGYLDQQQFQHVLEMQSSNHVLLGEALVRLGVVGKGRFVAASEGFCGSGSGPRNPFRARTGRSSAVPSHPALPANYTRVSEPDGVYYQAEYA